MRNAATNSQTEKSCISAALIAPTHKLKIKPTHQEDSADTSTDVFQG